MSAYRRWCCWVAGILLSVPGHAAWGAVNQATRYVEQSLSLAGPTGWINIPSTSVAGSWEMSAGIHRGTGKINFGILGFLETGIAFDADRLGLLFEPYRDLSSWEKAERNLTAFTREAFRGQAKLKILDQDWAGFGLAAGVERQSGYVVAQHYFGGTAKVMLLAGWGNGRFDQGFGGLSKTLFPGADLIFEFDGEGINVGLRMLLSSNLVMSIAGQQLNAVGEVQNLGQVISKHLVFGLTYVEGLW